MLLVFGVILMVLGTYANLIAMEHKTIKTDKLPIKKDTSINVPLKNTTSHSRLKPSKEIVVEIPINIVPLPLEMKKVQNATRLLSYQPIPIAQQEPSVVKIKPIATKPPVPKPIETLNSQPAPPAPQLTQTVRPIVISAADINREALQHEDQEIAIENKAKQADTVKDGANLDETKELLNAQVDEIKKAFVRQNQETQKLVLQKFEQIAEKVEKIEQKQEKPQIAEDKPSHKLTLEKFEEMAERVEKIVEHQEKEKLVEHQAIVTATAILDDAAAAPKLPVVVSTTPPKDTEKLVLKKFEEIAERVERIEQNQEMQKKEIDSVQPTRPDIMAKFEKIAEKVMKIEQNQNQGEDNVLAAARKETKLKAAAKPVQPNEAAVVQQLPSTVAPRNIVAPKLILEKFKRIDDYIDKIEKKQKEIEMITPAAAVAPAQATVAEVDQQDAQQLVLEKFEKIAERVEKIEQKQEEQKKIKTAMAVDETQKRVLEKFEKIAERVEKIEKNQQIEETEAAAAAAAIPAKNAENFLLQKLEEIAVKLENTEQVRAKKPDETMVPIAEPEKPKKASRLDAKVVREKLDEIGVKLEDTDLGRAKMVEQPKVAADPKPIEKLDPKIVLEKLDQNAVKLVSTDLTDIGRVADQNVATQTLGTQLPVKAASNLDAKVVLDKLDQIAKAVEKIDQKHKTNVKIEKMVVDDNQPNPVVKMIIDNQKHVASGNVKKRAESKVVPVPIMLLNTSAAAAVVRPQLPEITANHERNIETVAPVLETENPIKAFRRDLLAVKLTNDTASQALQREKRSIVDSVNNDCATSDELKKCYNDGTNKQLTVDNLLANQIVGVPVPIMAGHGAVGMQMFGRTLKAIDERTAAERPAADNDISR